MAREGGGEWYQSISFNKLSCRQVSFFGPKGTPSREEHKTPGSVLTTFIGALTYWCRKIPALLNLTKAGIAFPRHAPSIAKCFRRRCAYGDTMIKIFLKANLSL
jgi:hypothetical protein